MKLAIAQVNPCVGDLDGNLAKMLDMAQRACDQGAEAIVYPLYALTGGPLGGLGSSIGFVKDVQEHLHRFIDSCPILALVSAPVLGGRSDAPVPMTASFVVAEGRADVLSIPAMEQEQKCPIVQLGDGLTVAVLMGRRFDAPLEYEGLDMLVEMTATEYGQLGASPLAADELETAVQVAREGKCFLVNANLCGAQDDVVFSGNSLALGPSGALLAAAPVDAEELLVFELDRDCVGIDRSALVLEPEELVWRGVVTATRDYLHKNGFSDVLIGLSGGIDSAVVASAAVDALGADHVHGVLMPGPYSSGGSITDALDLAGKLGIKTVTVNIEEPMKCFHAALGEACGGQVEGLAAENLQARIRATYLMTISNARGWLLLNTGNKSEAAMGFSTLNGDTAGVYAPIGQLYKTSVYALARWRQAQGASIPQACIDKAPSAELYPGAKDADRLPSYDSLDAVLHEHVEGNRCAADIVAAGYDVDLVDEVLKGTAHAEFKRRLEPLGPLVEGVSLGSGGRAWPITNAWHDGNFAEQS